MNQILSVENNDNNNNYSNYGNNNYNNYKGGKKIEIKIIIVFFCIVLIVFGVFIIGNGINAIYNNPIDEQASMTEKEKTTASSPEISIEVVSDIERNIIITHDKEIKTVKYYWNNEAATEIAGNGKNKFEIKNIEVPPGTNTLNVIVTDFEGKEETYSKEQTSKERPWIKMTKEENAIKVVIESKTSNIAYITYFWDDKEPKKYVINDKKTQSTLEPKDEGEHVLTMKAVDDEGNEAVKVQKIIIVKAPELKVTTDGQNFIIRASDDEELTKMIINHNGNESAEEINTNKYETKIQALDGENRLIVTVYNKKRRKETSKIKVDEGVENGK